MNVKERGSSRGLQFIQSTLIANEPTIPSNQTWKVATIVGIALLPNLIESILSLFNQ